MVGTTGTAIQPGLMHRRRKSSRRGPMRGRMSRAVRAATRRSARVGAMAGLPIPRGPVVRKRKGTIPRGQQIRAMPAPGQLHRIQVQAGSPRGWPTCSAVSRRWPMVRLPRRRHRV